MSSFVGARSVFLLGYSLRQRVDRVASDRCGLTDGPSSESKGVFAAGPVAVNWRHVDVRFGKCVRVSL